MANSKPDWEDWTVRERKYLPQTLRSLTWHNLGYRFASKFGKSTRDEIRRVYTVAERFWLDEHSS